MATNHFYTSLRSVLESGIPVRPLTTEGNQPSGTQVTYALNASAGSPHLNSPSRLPIFHSYDVSIFSESQSTAQTIADSLATLNASGSIGSGFLMILRDQNEAPDEIGYSILQQWSYVQTQPQSAEFTASPLTGYPPLTVDFVNQSVGATTSAWTFTGGAPSTSPLTSPTVTYANPGSYSATLSINGGVSTKTRTNYINVQQYQFVTADLLPTFVPAVATMYSDFAKTVPCTGAGDHVAVSVCPYTSGEYVAASLEARPTLVTVSGVLCASGNGTTTRMTCTMGSSVTGSLVYFGCKVLTNTTFGGYNRVAYLRGSFEDYEGLGVIPFMGNDTNQMISWSSTQRTTVGFDFGVWNRMGCLLSGSVMSVTNNSYSASNNGATMLLDADKLGVFNANFGAYGFNGIIRGFIATKNPAVSGAIMDFLGA